jgi:uncharacterized membrane protein YbhN (UPF0104 family)
VKKKNLRILFVLLVSLLAILGFGYYIYINIDKYLELLRISTQGVLFIFLIALCFPVLNGIQNTLTYRGLGINISIKEGVIITAASTLVNQLPIPGGIVSKGIYLNRRFGLSYTLFASSIIALFLCFVTVSGIIGLLVLLFWYMTGAKTIPTSLLVGYSLMALCFLFIFLPLDRLWLPERIRIRMKQASEGWKMLNKTPALLFRIVSLQAFLMILLAGRYWLAFQMLSQDVTIGQVLLFSTASMLTQLVSIAPGGLGVREAIVGGVAGVLGFDISVGILAAGLDRIISTVVVFGVGWVSIAILGEKFVTAQASNEMKGGQ